MKTTYPDSSKNNGRMIYLRLLRYASAYWPAFLLGIIGTMIASGTDAAFAWLIKPLLDKGFIARDEAFIHWLPLILIMAFLLRNGAGFLSNYYMAFAGRNVVSQFRQDLFSHYMRLPAHYLDNTTSGQLLAKLIYNTEQVAKASTDSIVTLVQESCFITGLIIVMFINSWQLSLLFIVVVPVVAFIARKSSKRMRKLSQNVQQTMSGVTQVAEEGLEGYRVIRTFNAEPYEIKKFNALAEKNRQREMKTIATNSIATSAVQIVAAFLIAGTVYLATAKIAHITAGTFVSIISAMLAMLKPMRNLTTVNSAIQKGIAGAESIFAVLDENPEPDTGSRKLLRAKGEIQFSNVNFAYESNHKTVLKNISFQIASGQTVALVGRSGSGKSTLVSLLPRFYDNYSGLIQIDNINIRELTLLDLRRQLSLVSQHVVLFNDTIANNIAYGQFDTVSENDIIKAAEAANAMEFITQLPQGLGTMVGENGVLLSGGQRQRIAIARALLKNAPILILDEATSALDNTSERHIQMALEKLMHTRTTLVIAHRLSTVEKADNIIVLDEGNIVETGTHEALLKLKGHYARLHHKEFQDN